MISQPFLVHDFDARLQGILRLVRKRFITCDNCGYFTFTFNVRIVGVDKNLIKTFLLALSLQVYSEFTPSQCDFDENEMRNFNYVILHGSLLRVGNCLSGIEKT
jgi:hypothetical protein